MKMNRICFYLVVYALVGFIPGSVSSQEKSLKPKRALLKIVDQALKRSVDQYRYLMGKVPDEKFPRSFGKGSLVFSGAHAWTSGFYPGSLFYLYDFSKNASLKQEAEEKLKVQEKLQHVTTTHDLGFMLYCSYGNGYRLFKKDEYKNVLIQSARSLATRFNPIVGCIKSWDRVKSWDGETVWEFPVIIDNMMNLELLFFATKVTGDPSFKNIAIKHSEKTMENHIRPDNSTYHVVNYDPTTGKVKKGETHQGFSDNSTWTRGQAWGIYGFTMVYRETKDTRFVETAKKLANFFLDHPTLQKDKIAYWDFNVNQPGYVPQWKYDASQYPVIPRDASAAAITASALIELAAYVDVESGKKYIRAAEAMIKSLASSRYLAKPGQNGGFILKHSTGGVPSGAEVDVALTYADYYFIEALLRYRDL